VRFAGDLVELTEPALPGLVVAVPAEGVMHLVDEAKGEVDPSQAEEVADREGVGPEIAFGRPPGGEAGPLGERQHQLEGFGGAPIGGRLAGHRSSVAKG
jgi:hypothetical protein